MRYTLYTFTALCSAWLICAVHGARRAFASRWSVSAPLLVTRDTWRKTWHVLTRTAGGAPAPWCLHALVARGWCIPVPSLPCQRPCADPYHPWRLTHVGNASTETRAARAATSLYLISCVSLFNTDHRFVFCCIATARLYDCGPRRTRGPADPPRSVIETPVAGVHVLTWNAHSLVNAAE